MRVTVNGEEREVPAGLTVAALLAHIGAPREGVAVAKNDHVVRRAALDQEAIGDGDRIEIIRAVAGG